MNVLITGGTGTFGRAFASRLLTDKLSDRICIYSRGEHRQAEMRKDFGDDERLRFFIGDVRDRDRLRRAMEGVELVVHAAALKRVEVGQYNPGEMVKTNVNGAVNVVEAAFDARVPRVVGISSDKACEPLNAYGKSKALAEHVFLAANSTRGQNGTKFAVARYGNVIGSQGSVLPVWKATLAAGAKVVPVTDPECTRFFMTPWEACSLVLWVSQRMEGGELVVPNLPAFRLGDLAVALGAEQEIMGLGSGEKVHETMISESEAGAFTMHEGYWVQGWPGRVVLDGPLTSATARRLTVEGLKQRLADV